MGVDLKQEADGSLSFWNNIEGQVVGRVGGPRTASASRPIYRTPSVAKLALTASNSSIGGSVLSWQNPESVPIIITRVVINITTQSSATAAIDVGISSVATGKNDTLLDACSVTTAVIRDNIEDKGSNGKARQRVPVGYYVNAAKSSGTLGGALVANAYIEYIPS